MFGQKPKNMKLLPFIKKMTFGNFSANNLERGDILYFGYTGANRNDEIINPLIVFSGYDQENNLIYGVNLRNFYMDKQTPLGVAFLRSFERIYWDSKEDPNTHEIVKFKKKIPYTSPNAFTYEGLNNYSMTRVKKLINNKMVDTNYLREYWRGYTPKYINILFDNFLKLSHGNISVNIDTANVIINVAPKHVNMTQQLPNEGV